MLPKARLQGVTGEDFPMKKTVRMTTNILGKRAGLNFIRRTTPIRAAH